MSCPDTTPKTTCQQLASSGLPALFTQALSINERLMRLGINADRPEEIREAVLRGDIPADVAYALLPGIHPDALIQDELDGACVARFVSSSLAAGKFPDEREVVRAVTGMSLDKLRAKDHERLKSIRYALTYQLIRAYLDDRLDWEIFKRKVHKSHAGTRLNRWFMKRPIMNREKFVDVMRRISSYSTAELMLAHPKRVLAALRKGINLPQEALSDYQSLDGYLNGWQMTYEQFRHYWDTRSPNKVSGPVSHRALVRDALLDGKPVPAEVVMKYPDLLPLLSEQPEKLAINQPSDVLATSWRTSLSEFLEKCASIGIQPEKAAAIHRVRVSHALQNGEAVPIDVLLEYPDLMAEFGVSP